MDQRLSRGERTKLIIQNFVGWISLVPVYLIVAGLLRFRAKYKISNLAGIRRQFRLIASNRSPLIICANHLTLIDSVLMIWAFASPFSYIGRYRWFAWNIPAMENTKRRISWLILTYLAKCILLDRMGDASHTAGALNKLIWLLRQGQVAMLFPEGTRSRSGRINRQSINYGIGKILQRMPNCRVLCVYLRGRGQREYSDFPAKGETLDIAMEVIRPKTIAKGLRGASDLSRQVIAKLEIMERSHLERYSINETSAA